MIIKMHKFSVLIVLLALFCGTGLNFAQRVHPFDETRMNRDLNIMESILEKLLMGTKPFVPFYSKVRGYYLENYGVLFQINFSGSSFFIIQNEKLKRQMEVVKKQMESLKLRLKGETVEVNTENEKATEEDSINKQLAMIKEGIIEFFASYADAIGQLQPSDRISVLINFGNFSDLQIFSLSGGSIKKYSSLPSLLVATIKKGDLIAYRRGQISQKSFQKRIHFQERADDDLMAKNIAIMANILDAALDEKYYKEFGSSGKTRGIYLDDLGVMFFMEVEFTGDYVRHIKPLFIDSEESNKNTGKEQIQKTLKKFQKALVELIGDYSHTLHTLKPNEQVIVAVDFEKLLFTDEIPARYIIKIRKSDLDRYNRGRINLDLLMKRSKIMEYYY